IAFLKKNPGYRKKTVRPSKSRPSPVSAEADFRPNPPAPASSAAPPVTPRKTLIQRSQTTAPVKPAEKKRAVSGFEEIRDAKTYPVHNPVVLPEKKAVRVLEPVPRTKIVLSALKKVESTHQKEKKLQQQPVAEKQQEKEPVEPAEKYLKKIPGTADVLPVQYWSSDNYSRVVIKSSEPVSYQANLFNQQSGVPQRLFIDFKKSYIPPQYRSPVALEDGLLKRIQTSQLDATTVRVYLDTQSIADYKVFNLKDPFRVVVDVRGGKGRAALRVPKRKVAPRIITDIKQAVKQPLLVHSGKKKEAAGEKDTEVAKKSETPPVLESVAKSTLPLAPKTKTEKIILPRKRKMVPGAAGSKQSPAGENLTLAQQLGLGIRRIVIDPGHGGKDPGAVGFGLKEKDIVLNVAKKIRKILEKKNGYEVILTREGDVSLSLEERTAIANTKEADLFLSVHVNAHPEEGVRGVETFYLNLATHTEAMRVAALENATSTHNMSEMQDILAELMQNEKINESSQLAELVQVNLISGLKRQHFYVKDLGVKQAPFYVLIGAEMPAILAEISFITNRHEAKLMKNERYLQTLAEQIAAGVLSYAEKQRTAALNKGT
ncbi:MAG: N-acetylmuramoyl-L-alanine amidase, partial [Candidatus Electrothrix sp. EH2]|nr:N-acetylmuramoyl-L-alanine amidase [Candidatus Electrothrix sp. EH2]